MKMEEIIDKVSELYRGERKGINELETELLQIVRNLNEAYLDKGENITLAEYTSLCERKNYLEKEIELKAEHCEGIFAVREMLMDIGFDTEVENGI